MAMAYVHGITTIVERLCYLERRLSLYEERQWEHGMRMLQMP